MKRLSVKAFAGLLLASVFPAARPVSAGAPAQDCAHPFVFSDATVNFVVLPFTNSVALDKPLSAAASQLTLMVQTTTMFSILKYGSVGAVRLTASPAEQTECKPGIVAAKLLGDKPGAQATIRSGHGLILFWGRLYEEKGEIYMQSFARFLRKGVVAENVSLPIENASYEARLFGEAVAFAPQRLTPQDLAEISSEFNQFAVVYDMPTESSRKTRMPLEMSSSANVSYRYRVLEVQNEWMKIDAYGSGPSGWVHAGATGGLLGGQRMPELDFVDGIAGYLRLRGADGGDTKDVYLRTVSWAEAALKRYENVPDPEQAPLAQAVAKTVHGLLEMGPLEASSKVQTALQLFEEASDLVPYSGEARNLELSTRWYLAYRGILHDVRPGAIADGWLQAAVLSPEDPAILKNLENCYQLLLEKGPPPGTSPSGGLGGPELEKRLAALRSVENSTR